MLKRTSVNQIIKIQFYQITFVRAMKHFSVLLFLLIFSTALRAQEEADTNSIKDSDSLRNIKWVVDSAYGAFRTEKFSAMRPFFQSYKTYKALIDTSAAGDQSEYTKFAMYNTRWNYLRIQHARMIKKIHKQGIKWQDTELDSFYLEKGMDHGLNYAYINWILRVKKKKSYILSAVAIQVMDKWYIMDELKYVGMVPEPKKPKGKKRPKLKIPDNIKIQR